MATYKEIFGTNIEVLASDPANPVQGQVWYNSTDNVVKGAALTTAGAWATGNAMNTGTRGGGSGGTEASAIAVGGGPPDVGNTELYDGTSWTEVNDLNQARRGLGVGAANNTAALAYGGEQSPSAWYALTESWNGTSWTEVNDLNAGRVAIVGAGIQTSALALGGTALPVKNQVNESWNGTSWTEVADLNSAKSGTGRAVGDDNTVAIAVGTPSFATPTESWNGTSWTEVNDFNTGRVETGIGGDTSAALLFGGFGPPFNALTNTEQWNGTSWSETTDLNAAVGFQFSAGTGVSGAVSGGGYTGTVNTTNTEDWTGAGAPVTYTFTDS